jgi:hypothetical protein
VQARLFPQTLPPFGTLDYAGVCIQARQVGGDYYDFLHLGQERLGLVVGDIAGKGIAGPLDGESAGESAQPVRHRLEHRAGTIPGIGQPVLLSRTRPISAYATLFFAEYDNERAAPALRQLRASARSYPAER